MSKVLERLKAFYQFKEMSAREFSLSIGRSGGYFSNSLKKGSEPTADMLSTIFNKYPELSIEWVFTGEGPMENVGPSGEKSSTVRQEQKTIDKIIEDKIDDRISARNKSEMDALRSIVRELIVSEMQDELEKALRELEEEKKNDRKKVN